MSQILKYRLFAIILVCVFCVFNIGVPIVVASCPMMDNMTIQKNCCPPLTTTSQENFKGTKDYSCCQTIIAADRNTTEYTQTNDLVNRVVKFLQVIPSPIISTELTIKNNELFITSLFFSVRHLQDIPIFTSSLLL